MLYNERLKRMRERVGVTQKDISEKLNIDRKTYSHYENEDVIIPIKHLNYLCNYFDISIDYVFGFTDLKQHKESRNEVDREKMKIRIKEFRKENKLTQIKLANILNIASGTIAEYERGTNIIATPFLYTICKSYNISADYILGKIDYIPKF